MFLSTVSKGDFYSSVVIGSVFLIIGSACAVGAFFMFRNSYRKIKNWKTTDGMVVDYYYESQTQSMRSKPYYAPRIQFTTDDGKQFTCVASTGSTKETYRVGAKVKVLYSPNDPQKADLKSFANLWLMPVLLGGLFGSASLGGSLFLFINLIIDSLK